mgnify:CR=1 FL=1
MAPKVDSLTIATNARPLLLSTKSTNNDSIEVFSSNTQKANVDEVNISNQNNNSQIAEITDNKRKWLIGLGIAIGSIVIGVGTAVLLKKLPKGICKAKPQFSRWENPLQDYTPSFTGASQHSPLHHGIDRNGSHIRDVFNYIKSGKPNKRQLSFIEAYLPIAQRMDESLSKMPPLEKDCIVYRGILKNLDKAKTTEIFRIFDDCKPGDIITPDSGYSYCAFKKRKTTDFGGFPIKDKRTISQTIRLPKGAKVSRSGLHEGEVLMPRNAEYRVISKTVNGNHTEVTLEYILPKKDNLQEVNELMARYNLKSEPLDEIIKEFS